MHLFKEHAVKNPDVRPLLARYVCLRLPVSYQYKGERLLDHSALVDMLGKFCIVELSCGKRPAEELYDLKKDPFELVNVAGKAEYAKAQAGLRAELDRWMADTNDPRVGPGGGDDRWDTFQYFGAPAKKKAKGG